MVLDQSPWSRVTLAEVAGLSLPGKLRRGLGNGQIVPAEEIGTRLAPYDADGDGAVTLEELSQFLLDNRVGGPWFSNVLAKTLWRIAEERWLTPVRNMRVAALANIIHFSMTYPEGPSHRYVISGEVMVGLAPKRRVGEPPEPAPPPKPKVEASAPAGTQDKTTVTAKGAPSPAARSAQDPRRTGPGMAANRTASGARRRPTAGRIAPKPRQ
jgi:hypothetical protein